MLNSSLTEMLTTEKEKRTVELKKGDKNAQRYLDDDEKARVRQDLIDLKQRRVQENEHKMQSEHVSASTRS